MQVFQDKLFIIFLLLLLVHFSCCIASLDPENHIVYTASNLHCHKNTPKMEEKCCYLATLSSRPTFPPYRNPNEDKKKTKKEKLVKVFLVSCSFRLLFLAYFPFFQVIRFFTWKFSPLFFGSFYCLEKFRAMKSFGVWNIAVILSEKKKISKRFSSLSLMM